MIKLIIKGSRREAALALAAHDIAIMEDLREIPSALVPESLWTEARVHECYAPKARAWFHETHKVPFRPGDLLWFHETSLGELLNG